MKSLAVGKGEFHGGLLAAPKSRLTVSTLLSFWGGREKTEAGDYKREEAKAEEEGNKVTGVVTNNAKEDVEAPTEAEGAETEATVPRTFSNSWKINFVLGVISCWFAMAMTSWGSIKTGGNVANPDAGSVSMWIIIASQWLVLALFLWTLVAPRLFPGRDFS